MHWLTGGREILSPSHLLHQELSETSFPGRQQPLMGSLLLLLLLLRRKLRESVE